MTSVKTLLKVLFLVEPTYDSIIAASLRWCNVIATFEDMAQPDLRILVRDFRFLLLQLQQHQYFVQSNIKFLIVYTQTFFKILNYIP